MTTDADDYEYTSPKKSGKPSHIAFHIRHGNNGHNYWSKIGVAWPHSDGLGFSIQLDAMPMDGYISLRPYKEKPH
jgi:hypothetical protein